MNFKTTRGAKSKQGLQFNQKRFFIDDLFAQVLDYGFGSNRIQRDETLFYLSRESKNSFQSRL